MTNIAYSDGTPSASFTLDRLGRQRIITDGTGTRAFAYNDALQLDAETNAFGTITRQYYSFGRSSGLAVGADYQIGYGYSNDGRFASVTSSVQSVSSVVNYSYLPGTDLLSGYTNSAGFAVTRAFEQHRDLLTAVSNRYNDGTVSAFDYINDAIARRTQRIDSGSATATNAFGYNPRSELTSAAMGTNAYGYTYDPIGNRTAATNNAEALTYAANALNQYTNITDGMTLTPTYDLDGNLTNYNGWSFGWDAENRLISAEQVGTAVPAVRFAYDYMSRRVQKIVGSSTNTFLYDDWNLARETTSTGLTNDYVWGLDLSGTQQGAGGIGGLMAVVRNNQTYYPVADANGNVTDYVDANGAVVAHYEFDAFGNTVAQSGTLADAFVYRFSTKYLYAETGMYYYGYRYYSPELGRWVSRDPIGEEDFMRLHEDDVKREIVDYRGTDTDNNGVRVVQDVVSLMDVLLATSPNLYGGFFNDPVIRGDAVGLKCEIYLMMGHFGATDEKNKGWLWTQLGTSTAKLGECDGVYSISCHMKSFVDTVATKVPGVITPKGWPPKPYDDDRKIACSDVPTLYNQTEAMNTSMADAIKKDAKCCCKEVNFHVMCDEDMKECTKSLVENPKKGIIQPSLPSDPCGGVNLDKKY